MAGYAIQVGDSQELERRKLNQALAGLISYGAVLPTLPSANYQDGSLFVLTPAQTLYMNQANLWVLLA